MSYKALLFCPEQKTLRTVTQILSELDFEIEACHEPFAAVKRLTTEHFDAIVVDCENQQNATLLFKSSRHSSSNRAALSIAVVEGQAGVASAFRIGANLVLTKPINVEQSKGTIRVARGLLRKSDASKPAHSLVGTPASLESAVAAAEPRSSTMREMPAPRLPLPSAGFSESEFELEKEPEVRPEPTEAALLESMQDPASEVLRAREAESQAAAAKLQGVSNPGAGTLPAAGQATDGGRTSEFGGSGAAAAPAPAPASQESFEEQRKILSEAPMFSTSESEQSSASGKKKLIIAIVVLLLGVGVYLALSKPHDQPAPTAPSAPAVTQPQAAPAPVAQPTNPEPSSTAPPAAQPSGDTTPAHRPSGSDKTPSSTKTPKTKKTA
jgi:DNA-binding response OmpR family regulator